MGIKDHKWSDGSLALFEATSEGLWLVVNDTDANINKSDAIAIAKHFGLIDDATRCPSCDSSTACGC